MLKIPLLSCLAALVFVSGPAFAQAPTITSMQPSGGVAGLTIVTINGTNFGATSAGASVSFGGVTAPIDSSNWTPARILITVPANAVTGPITVKTSVGAVSSSTVFTVNSAPKATNDKYMRAVVGIDLSATSAQATRTNAFLEFTAAASPGHNHIVWLWLDPSIATVPQQASSILSTVTTANPSFNSLLGTQLNQLVSSFETNVGMDVDFWKPDLAKVNKLEDTKVVLAFTMGAGFQTPLAVTQANVEEFTVPGNLSSAQLHEVFGANPPTICSSTVTTSCISTVAFQPPDRSHFFKQYWAGVRLKSYYYGTDAGWSKLCAGNGDVDQPCPIYPGTVDLTVGQNEAVSGGNLHGFLLRVDAYYPLWFNPAFYAFFNAWIHLNRHNENPFDTPVILNPVTSPPTDPTQIEFVPVSTPDRDYYRVGMGIDLLALIRHFTTDAKQPQS